MDNKTETKTLTELGIDGGLAREIKCAMKVTGKYFTTFISPMGKRYRVNLEEATPRNDVPEAA